MVVIVKVAVLMLVVVMVMFVMFVLVIVANLVEEVADVVTRKFLTPQQLV